MNPPHTKFRALLVDDSQLALAKASYLFQAFHCLLDCVTTGEETLAYIRKNTYDIIFMDLGLPHLDGLSTTEAVRSLEASLRPDHCTPIVALTAHRGQHIEITCKDHGMDDYLHKPLTRGKLLQVLKKYQIIS